MSEQRSWTRKVMRFLGERRGILLICLLALAVRMAFFLALDPWDEEALKKTLLVTDAAGYHSLAVRIVASGAYPTDDAFRTPGYPLFVALTYRLFGERPAAVLLLQVLLDVVLVVVTYLLAREVFESRAVGHIAAFLYSISLLSAFYSTRLLTEIPFTFVFTIGVLVFIRALKARETWGFALSGFVMGLATLVRPVLQFFPPLMAVVVLLQGRGDRVARRILGAVVLLLVFAVTLSPWQFRNYRLFGHYSLSNIRGLNLCCYNAAIPKANLEGLTREEAQRQLEGTSLEGVTNPFEQEAVWRQKGLEFIRAHMAECVRYHLRGSLNVFLGTAKGSILTTFGLGSSEWREKVAHSEDARTRVARIIRTARTEYFLSPILATKQLIEYAFVVVGCVVAFRSRERRLYVLVLLLGILYLVGVTGVVGHSRFRVPVIPLYVATSASGMFEAFELWKRRRWDGRE